MEDPLNTSSMSPTSPSPARQGGRAEKRWAIIRGARSVFGREGYSRTSIDAIATEAGVSTRTIYNHFEGKDQLFSEVLHASATQVADSFIETVEQRVGCTDLTTDLVALGHAFVAQRTQFPEHFAMIRQIKAEVQHFPAAVIDTWQQAGPMRVQREVSRRLSTLADAGLLRIKEPARATVHFIALVNAEITIRAYGTAPLTDAELDVSVTLAVEAFLHGYQRSNPQ